MTAHTYSTRNNGALRLCRLCRSCGEYVTSLLNKDGKKGRECNEDEWPLHTRQLMDQTDLSDSPMEWKLRKYYNHLYLIQLSEHDGSS